MQDPTTIVVAIEAVAERFGATAEQAWGGIKSKAAAGLLTLQGIDDEDRLCPVERHWMVYIKPWRDGKAGVNHALPGMPDRDEGIIAFDRQCALQEQLTDKANRLEPYSLPPIRLRGIVTDGAHLDELWSRAEREFKSQDWSLGKILSWIIFKDPVFICEFERRRDWTCVRKVESSM
jgi:hypothetical protein